MFSDFMGDIFEQLLSKTMFYEPMKELNEKVNEYLIYYRIIFSLGCRLNRVSYSKVSTMAPGTSRQIDQGRLGTTSKTVSHHTKDCFHL